MTNESGKMVHQRDDAQPRTDLTAQQTDVLRQLIAALHERVAQPRTKELQQRDANRTLKEQFGPRLHPLKRNNVFLIDGKRGTGKTTVLVSLLQQLAKDTHPDLAAAVGLHIVSIETLPQERSTAFQLLTTLGRVVDALCNDNRHERPASVIPTRLAPHEPVARTAFRKLTKAVALGWTDAAGRRAQTDPQDFINEFQDSEQWVADIEQTFHTFMDALSEAYKERQGLWPLFVLPIDDADMQPGRTPDLMEMLRVFWHPNLFVVMTGDTDLFQAGLRNQCLQQLRGKLRSDLFLQDDQNEASTLAVQILEKVIPQAQRLKLREVDLPKRIILAGLFEEDLGGGIDSETLMFALPETLRSLADLNLMVARNQQNPSVIVYEIFARAIDSDGHLMPLDDRRRLANSVRLDDQLGDPLIRIGLDFPPALFWRTDRTPQREDSLAVHVQHVVCFRGRTDDKDRSLTWPDRISASTLLVWLYLEGKRSARLEVPVGFDESLLLVANHRKLLAAPVVFVWPVPAYRELSKYLALSRIWNTQDSRLGKADGSALLFTFLSTILEVSGDGANLRSSPPVNFPQLSNIVRQLATVSDRVVLEWFDQQLPLIAAPESGLPAVVANNLLELWFTSVRPRDRTGVIEARSTRMRMALPSETADLNPPDTVVNAVDANSPDFNFALRMYGWKLPPVRAEVTILTEYLTKWSFTPPHGNMRSAVWTLGQYLTEGRKSVLSHDLPSVRRMNKVLQERTPVPGALGIIAQLWRLFNLLGTSVRFGAGKLTVSAEVDVPEQELIGVLSRPVGSDASLLLSRFSSRFTLGSATWSGAAQVLYDIARDLEADLGTNFAPKLKVNKACKVEFAELEPPNVITFCPPMPDWPAPVDVEYFQTSSNNAVDALLGVLEDESDVEGTRQALEAYYLWLIDYVKWSCVYYRFPTSTELGVSLERNRAQEMDRFRYMLSEVSLPSSWRVLAQLAKVACSICHTRIRNVGQLRNTNT